MIDTNQAMTGDVPRSSPAGGASPAEDRDRQIAAAAWILGWIGGPLPAIIMLLVVDSPRWSRRLIGAAALFWAVFAALAVVAATGHLTVFAWLWIAAVIVAFAGTVVGAWAAFRASQRRTTRRSW
jgi:multisubunit Na+/H+ antiporter MnhF subunit